MNDELGEVGRIEREVAAEVGALLAILGTEPTVLGVAAADDDGWDALAAIAAAPDACDVDVEADAAADAAILALVLATGRRVTAEPARPRDHVPARRAARAPRPATGPRRQGWWWGAAASAAVALGLGGALALNPSAPAMAGAPPMLRFAAGDAFRLLDPGTIDTLPSAHDALLELGDAASTAVDPPSGGAVQFVELDAWFSSSSEAGTVIEPVHRDSWLAPDGSVRAEEARYGGFDPWGNLTNPSIPPGVHTSVDEIPAGSFDPTLAVAASTDPAQVLSDLMPQVEVGGCDGVELDCTVGAIEGLFMQYDVPSATRAAIWRAFSARSDLRLMGAVTDRLGRDGVGIGFRESSPGLDSAAVLIVDPASGDLLGVEKVVHLADEQPRLAKVMAVSRSATVATVGDKP